MQVILLERVAKLGQMGEVVEVKPGYARNYLLPQGKALTASQANIVATSPPISHNPSPSAPAVSLRATSAVWRSRSDGSIASDASNIETEGQWPALKVTRTLYFDTDRDIPKALLKIVRGMTRVHESLRFDASEGKMEVALRVPVIGKLVDYGYVYRWTELDDGESMEIDWKGHCDVRIPLVRRMAENYLLGELEDATKDGGAYIAEYFGAPDPSED